MKPISENAVIPVIPAEALDARLAVGWRHFGTRFFRCNFAIHGDVLCGILPLRIRVGEFTPTRNQRRVERRNADARVAIVPTVITPEIHDLFARHKARFVEDAPESIFDFLSAAPSTLPCENQMIEVRLDGHLVAVSFLDIGVRSVSSVYAMFDPRHARRSPGIFTMLCEVAFARRRGMQFYYPGYCYTVPSPYDYKKRFHALEAYDWDRQWTALDGPFEWSRLL